MSDCAKSLQPIILLPDSQLLFATGEKLSIMNRVAQWVGACPDAIRAAYLGASNGDQPEFYEIFVAAMAQVGIVRCHHVRARPTAHCLAFLKAAHVILLSGGEVGLGWRRLQEAGLVDRILHQWHQGAVLLGVSAGAVQLGLAEARGQGPNPSLLSLVPFLVDVHDEPHWKSLKKGVREYGGGCAGLAVPSGSGVIVYPSGKLEFVGRTDCEILS